MVFMRNKNIVVTGGAGFIGSNLTGALAEKNNVIVVDDLSTGNKNNISDLIDSEKIEFINGSITDFPIPCAAPANICPAVRGAGVFCPNPVPVNNAIILSSI